MDEEKYKEASKKIADKIKARLGGSRMDVIYSAYKTDQDRIPIDNLDEVAFEGKIRIREKKESYWGDKNSEDYESRVLENPTWLDLAVIANECIQTVRDFHHVFLEGFTVVGEEDGVKIATLWMGS
jgi:hypothetical protein